MSAIAKHARTLAPRTVASDGHRARPQGAAATLQKRLGNRALSRLRLLQRAQVGRITTPKSGNAHFTYELDAAIDSYAKLAAHYGVSVGQITAENPDVAAGDVREGRSIRVPAINPPAADSQPRQAGVAHVVKGAPGSSVPVLWSRGGNKVGDIEAGRSVFVFFFGGVDVPLGSVKNQAGGIVDEMTKRNLVSGGMMLFGHIDPANLQDKAPVGDNAGRALIESDRKQIEALLQTHGLPAATPLASVAGAKVLLHDTSAPVGAASIQTEKSIGRGPLGKGVSAWVPRSGDATIARPDFFETARPSTSEYEKGIDLIKQADREQAVKDIWSVTKDAEKEPALDRALAGTGLTADETKSVKAGAIGFFAGTPDKDLPDGAKSAATWAVGQLCAKAAAGDSAALAADKKKAEFDAGCAKLATYFKERTARVGSIVSIEIVQVGVKDSKKNLNTCDPANPNMKPMPSPPYSDSQYANIALIYLRAALAAGRFPEITTHFVVDAFEKGHCDPRCFDLQKLYDTIAALFGHGKGSTYGIKPSYGTKWGTDNIWWDNSTCGGPHP